MGNMKKGPIFFIFFFFFSFFLFAQEEGNRGITIENRHVVAEMTGKELHITDAILLNIQSVDGTEEPNSYSIPAGYRDFEILSGLDPDSLTFEEDRVVDTRIMTEGKMRIAFKYVLPFQRNSTTLTFQVYHETQVFYFLMKNLELRITSDELVSEGLIDMGKRSYHALSAVAFQPAEHFTITISGFGKQMRRKQVLIFVFIVIVIVIIITAFAIRKEKPESDDLLLERKKILISIIALLDEKREKGEIGETVYRELRNENKKKLQHIIETTEKLKEKDAQA